MQEDRGVVGLSRESCPRQAGAWRGYGMWAAVGTGIPYQGVPHIPLVYPSGPWPFLKWAF